MAVDSIARALAISGGGSVTRTSQLINDSGFIGGDEAKHIKEDVDKNSKQISNVIDVLNGRVYNIEYGAYPAFEQDVLPSSLPYAAIEKIIGNSFNIPQVIKNGDFSSGDNWAGAGTATTFTTDTGAHIASLIIDTSASGQKRMYQRMDVSVPSGHKVLMRFDFKSNGVEIGLRYGPSDTDKIGTGADSASVSAATVAATTDWTKMSTIFTTTKDCDYFTLGTLSAVTDMSSWQIKNVNVFDLTEMFGAGNEPESVEDFENIFTKDFYNYNSLISLSCEKIISYDGSGNIIDQFEIDDRIKSYEGYGEKENYIDLEAKTFTAYGRYIDGTWYDYAKPVVEDISEYLTHDNFIKVDEDGGWLEFVNQEESQFPTKVSVAYMVKISIK